MKRYSILCCDAFADYGLQKEQILLKTQAALLRRGLPARRLGLPKYTSKKGYTLPTSIPTKQLT
jgi:hypothetical protein